MKKMLLAAALVPLAGCATVVRGAKDTANFESEPPGATVTVESVSEDKLGPFECVTPCEMELKRKRDWRVQFDREGYKPVTGKLHPKVTGGGVASGVGNVLAGGLIGIGVDAGTGANLDLRPNPITAILVPLDSDQSSTVNKVKDDEEDVENAETRPSAESDAAPEDAAASIDDVDPQNTMSGDEDMAEPAELQAPQPEASEPLEE